MRRRGDITVASVAEGLIVGAIIVVAWFGCAGLVGLFAGIAWRVAQMVQP